MIPENIMRKIPVDPVGRDRWIKRYMKIVRFKPDMEVRGITQDDVLRRFVDLPKLFDLLANKRLVLPPLGSLMAGDPFECHAKRSYSEKGRKQLEERAIHLRDYAPKDLSEAKFLAGYYGFHSSWFEDDVRKMTLDELKSAVWYLERAQLKRELVCSCWFRGIVESDAIWKIYANQLGVAITSSVSRLKHAVRGCLMPRIYTARTKLILAPVSYEDVEECGYSEPWLIKRKAFGHEAEARLYCETPFVESPGLELEVDVPDLVKEIVVTPFASPWQFRAIKAAIDSLLGYRRKAGEYRRQKIEVRQSRHMRPPDNTWPARTIEAVDMIPIFDVLSARGGVSRERLSEAMAKARE